MKKIFGLLLISVVLISCKSKKAPETIIEKPVLAIENGQMTPEVLWGMGRITEMAVSPDGQTVIFGVRYFDIAENKGNTDVYSVKIDGSDMKQIIRTETSEFNLAWRSDGKKIAYVSGGQMWETNPDGTHPKQISDIEGGIEGFKYAPDMTKIVFVKAVKVEQTAKDIYPDLDKTTGLVYDDLMYRHWDTWSDGTVPHVFVADYNGNAIANEIDVIEGEPFEAPMRPHGGMEQINWSPDSKTIAYTCRKLTGKAYALSTNSDIFLYNIENKTTVNISNDSKGYDWNPVFSPDGKKIAWESMERDGYESDKLRLMVYDLDAKTTTQYIKNWEESVTNLLWSQDANTIYFISNYHATSCIYGVDLMTDSLFEIAGGQADFVGLALAGNKLVGMKQTTQLPTDLYTIDLQSKTENQITFVNKDVLDQLKPVDVKERWTKTTDNKQMLSWVVYPPDFDSTKTYPVVMFCAGGPQNAVSQFFSYRWNFRLMASQGYIVIAPNRRGVPGFGKEWIEQISGDYGGQNMKDYLSAIDDIAKEKYVNKDALGCVGASYGGFSVYWLAGHHEKRFKAFIAHNGMFNIEQHAMETEEMWFPKWDQGGLPWDKNPVVQRTLATSPHKFVDKWDTPIMVVVGQKDYRIPYSQGLAAYNAAVLHNIPAELLVFEDENHWVLKPQNGILWQRRFFNFLDTYLK